MPVREQIRKYSIDRESTSIGSQIALKQLNSINGLKMPKKTLKEYASLK